MATEASAPKSAPPVPDVTYKYTFFGSKGAENEHFNAPMGMAFNREKTEIFVADSSNNRVQVLNYDRKTGGLTFKRTISNKVNDKVVIVGSFNQPTGVAFGLSGKLEQIIVADRANNKVCGFECVNPFKFLGEYDVDRPCSVAVDNSGNIFAYDISSCRIKIFMNDNTENNICEKGTADGQLGDWGTLAFDKDDRLVVADAINNRVQVLNKLDGAHIRTITGTISGGVRGELKHPCGIAFTEDYEHIIIADFENNRVCVLTYADGKIVKSFGSTKGDAEGQFNGPYGVLVDDKYGRIIVSEEYNHRIQVIHNAFPKKPAKLDIDPDTKLSKLRTTINEEINAFIAFLKSKRPKNDEHIEILTGLINAIQKDRDDRKKTDDDALRNHTERQRKKGKLPKSQQLPKTKVTEFINAHPDDIFVVTGGSFNPPHNGHIGMFQKAYEALIKNSKITMDDGKKVYGVMAPATDDWIENKLCKEVTPATKTRAAGVSSDCTDAERAEPLSKAAIELKRIQLANRVNLCKLSCDSYAWPESDKFNASNMIVVNETAEGEEFTSQPNTYYLCGSDYYKDSDTKFICVLRKDDTRERDNLVRIGKDGKTERVPIKDTDIIIENDGEDNDASSTMLRKILTNIRDDKDGNKYDPEEPIKTKLLTKQVYCELLKMGYIVEKKKGKVIAELLKCGDDKAIIPMKLTGKAIDPNKPIFIKDLVDSFDKCNNAISSNRSSFSSKEVTDILNRVYNNGHYMLLNDIHFMNTKSSGQPLIFQLMSQKDKADKSINSLKYFTETEFDIEDETIYTMYKAAFDALPDTLKQVYETLCKFLFETERNAILCQILRANEDDKAVRTFAGTMRNFYGDLLTKEGNARDSILEAVGYTFKSAYGDGNCFYNSAGMQLIDPMTVDEYTEYDKLARDEQWQKTQFQKQGILRTALTAYLQKLYAKLQSHPKFATSESISITYLREKGATSFKNVSTIRSGVDRPFWGTDDELHFIAALYNCFIVILPSNDTNFQTIEYIEEINSDEAEDKLFKALSDPSIPVLSPDGLITKLGEVTTAKKQIIFMLGGKGHWDYAIPSKT